MAVLTAVPGDRKEKTPCAVLTPGLLMVLALPLMAVLMVALLIVVTLLMAVLTAALLMALAAIPRGMKDRTPL